MPVSDESRLVVAVAAGPAALDAVRAAWSAGEAVAVVDPAAPAATVAARLEALRPEFVVDHDGRTRRADALPVPAGTAAVVATSGTTAEPKLVVHTHASLEASARAVSSVLAAGPDDVWLACVPLSSIAGLAIVARAEVGGQDVVALRRFETGAVAAAAGSASRRPATLVSLVPTMLRRLLSDAPDAPARFRRILLGGGPVPDGLLAEGRAAGAAVTTTYGQTETGGGCVHDGRPLPGVEVRVDGPPGATGEILVRGAVVTPGFLRDPEATRSRLSPGGWWHTRDAGRIDADGRLTVVDRLDDLVITGGVNVSPTAIEVALATHPDVADVMVTGRPDPEWGERVVAYVVPRDPSNEPTLAALREHGRAAGLGAAELPREVVVVRSVPRTPNGKPIRRLTGG